MEFNHMFGTLSEGNIQVRKFSPRILRLRQEPKFNSDNK